MSKVTPIFDCTFFVRDGFEISVQELKKRGFIGEIMYDIAFFEGVGCRDKEAYLELLEVTAKNLIKKMKRVP